MSCSTWGLSSPTRDRTHVPCTARWIPSREVPGDLFGYCPWGWCARISWVGNQNLLLNVSHCSHHEKLSRPEHQLSWWRQSAPGGSLMELLSDSWIACLRISSNGTKKKTQSFKRLSWAICKVWPSESQLPRAEEALGWKPIPG